MTKISIAFADLTMRGSRVDRPLSTFLGYGDATLVISAGGTEVLKMRFRNMQLKVVNGVFRFDFHAEQGENGTWYPTVFPKSAISRKRLTGALQLAYSAHRERVLVAQRAA